MWRCLRNRRLILRLHYYLGTHILGASRGGPCDSTALVYGCQNTAILVLLIQLPGGQANDHKNTYDVPIVAYRRARQGEGTCIIASGVEFDALLPSVVTITGKDVMVDCSSIIFCKAVRGILIVKHNCTTNIQGLQCCYIVINQKSRNIHRLPSDFCLLLSDGLTGSA